MLLAFRPSLFSVSECWFRISVSVSLHFDLGLPFAHNFTFNVCKQLKTDGYFVFYKIVFDSISEQSHAYSRAYYFRLDEQLPFVGGGCPCLGHLALGEQDFFIQHIEHYVYCNGTTSCLITWFGLLFPMSVAVSILPS